MGFAYKITEQQGLHFVTATIVQWVDVFTRSMYTELLLESLRFCQKNKGLFIYGWVVMSNHIHMICSCREGFNLSDTLRDFKKFTATAIVNAIENNQSESRKSWLLWLLKQNGNVQFWQPGNHPEEIRSADFFRQKLNYIHQNPVRAGIVEKEEEYRYSSACDFYNRKGLLELSYYI
jgi:REP element-mobilizing transposase RayT